MLPPVGKVHGAGTGFQKARQQAEQRGLARAVGADQGGDRPPLHLQIDIIQRFDAAEMHHQMLNA